MTIQDDLLRACINGDRERVKALLAHPDIDVNAFITCDDHRFLGPFTSLPITSTPLAFACMANQFEIVKLLLKDERVDVNKEPERTFQHMFLAPRIEIIELFLAKENMNVNFGDQALFANVCKKATTEKDHKAINLLLVDGRINIYQGFPLQEFLNRDIDRCNFPLAKSLLAFHYIASNKSEITPETLVDMCFELLGEDFIQKTIQTLGISREMMQEHFKQNIVPHILPGMPNEIAKLREQRKERKMSAIADMFALFVLLSDGFLKLNDNPQNESTKKTVRFFSCATKLPMDLQMVLTNRYLRSPLDIVTSKFTEPALKRQVAEFKLR